MKILQPRIDQKDQADVEYIVKDHVYVMITDFGLISILKQVLLSPGRSTWIWVAMKAEIAIDIYHQKKILTFDEAINKAVNDLYCTVYKFGTYREMVNAWDTIRYKDDIGTVYKESTP